MRGILKTNVYESKIALTPALSRGERGFFSNLLITHGKKIDPALPAGRAQDTRPQTPAPVRLVASERHERRRRLFRHARLVALARGPGVGGTETEKVDTEILENEIHRQDAHTQPSLA